MMFSLVLHSAHVDHGEKVSPVVVSGGDNLVLDERQADLFLECGFLLMVSYEHVGSAKSSDKLSEQNDPNLLIEKDTPVQDEQDESLMHKLREYGVVVPSNKEELEQITLVFMLYISILRKVVGKHVVQVVLLIPPLATKPTNDGSENQTKTVCQRITTVHE